VTGPSQPAHSATTGRYLDYLELDSVTAGHRLEGNPILGHPGPRQTATPPVWRIALGWVG